MQDIISDFYKRFTHDGAIAEKVSCPASVCLFSGGRNFCPEVGLRLSFGAEAAYSKRKDGRIVLARSDSDTLQSTNVADYPKGSYADWAEEIISSILQLPIKQEGVQMLLHTDVGLPELAPRTLCAVFAAAKISGKAISAQSVLRCANYSAYCLASLIPQHRVCIVNSQTLDYAQYNLETGGRKIIVVKTNARRKNPNLSGRFSEREAERIGKAALCLADDYIKGLGELMCESSRDMLKTFSDNKMEQLFEIILEFSRSVRILPDYSGAVFFAENENVDNFIMLIGDKYEKKTGTRPAFYISD
ncbi:MAG: hypothetical protein KIG65_05885 [Eubacteriales bacterium]|nr:hypothetical protein [Eubacteriales bacterium]